MRAARVSRSSRVRRKLSTRLGLAGSKRYARRCTVIPEDAHDISAPRMRLTPVSATAAAASSHPVVVSWSVSAMASSPA